MRLAWIQFHKRSPINFRKILLVKPGYNSKGLALLIQSYIYRYKHTSDDKYLKRAYKLAGIIIENKSKHNYFCAGYNFFWEAKAFSVFRNKPNMIVSTFVAQSFLDLYEIDKNIKWLNLANESTYFINSDLKLIHNEEDVCFGYIPGENAIVHNANLMGARLLSRLYNLNGEDLFKELAYKSLKYSMKSQRKDGAWIYGNAKHWKWIDNFHTGFNLVAIKDIQRNLDINEFNENINKGFNFHINNHFTDDLLPKYYDNSLYPIDIHNFAQGIDTFIEYEQV